jgi:hypothetical protein
MPLPAVHPAFTSLKLAVNDPRPGVVAVASSLT